jgi:hypothetical protein
MMDHLLDAEVMFPPVPTIFKPGAWIVNRSLRAATIATMPRWQRKLANLHQSRLVDSAVVLPMKIAFRLAAASRSYQLRLLGMISPGTVPVVEPMLRGTAPRSKETLSPAEAFMRHGVPRPRELYAQMQHGL